MGSGTTLELDTDELPTGLTKRARQGGSDWPSEVDFILSALDAGAGEHDADRREVPRTPYHVKASLRLFSDAEHAPAHVLYTREASSRGIGFISPRRLPLSHGGVVEIMTPGGELRAIHCTLFRCREVSSGWFEGALYFNRDQWEFGTTEKK